MFENFNNKNVWKYVYFLAFNQILIQYLLIKGKWDPISLNKISI